MEILLNTVFRKQVAIFIVCLSAVFVFANDAQAATLSKPSNNLGLVGYWSFDDGAGTVATDFSGNGNHGTLQGGMDESWVAGSRGKALSFDGVDDYAVLPSALKITDYPVSIAFWVNPIEGDASNDRFYLVTTTRGGYNGYAVMITPDDQVATGASGNTSSCSFGARRDQLTTSSPIERDTWQHISVIFNGEDDRQVYVDGIVQPLGGFSGSGGGATLAYAGGVDVVLGSTPNNGCSSTPEFSHSEMDDVRVYSRALSESEVEALYESGQARVGTVRTAVSDGLVAHWTFDGQHMRTGVEDASGNGHTGTLNGQAATTTTIGRVGQALSFDGVDDYVAVDNNADLILGISDFTLATWFYVDTIGQRNILLSKGSPNTESGSWQWEINSDNTIRFAFGAGGSWSTGSSGTIAIGWNHILMSVDRDGDITYYIDGVNAGSESSTSYTLDSDNTLMLGRNRDDNAYAQGVFDDMRIYNKALSEEEVQQIYREGEGVKAQANTQTLTQDSSLADGLIGHWTLDGRDVAWSSATAGTVTDRGSGGNSGTLVSMNQRTSPTIGKLGQALTFSKSGNSYVDFGDTLDAGTDDITLTAWVRADSGDYNSGGIVGKPCFCSKRGRYSILISSGGEFTLLSQGTSGNSIVDSNITPVVGEWYFLAGVIDRSSNSSLYVNGEFRGSDSKNTSAENWDTDDEFSIGIYDGGGRTFPGVIDDVRVYNRVLSEAEIQQLYRLGL